MRYSYAWDVRLPEICAVDDNVLWDGLDAPPHPLEGQYVRLRGVVQGASYVMGWDGAGATEKGSGTLDIVLYAVSDRLWRGRQIDAVVPETRWADEAEEWLSVRDCGKGAKNREVEFVGRFIRHDGLPGGSETPLQHVVVDTTASRFTGASIAGLVVGAMGVFVFAVALRHWLGERRQGHG